MLTVSGALFFNTIDGDFPDAEALQKVGKNSSEQYLPFTVSIAENGRRYVTVSAYALRNMIGVANPLSGSEKSQILNHFDFVSYEYSDRLIYTNVESHKIAAIKVAYKFGLVESKNKKSFLAFTLAGDEGIVFKTNINNGTTILSQHDAGLNLNGKLGFEINTRIGKKTNLNYSITANKGFAKYNLTPPKKNIDGRDITGSGRYGSEFEQDFYSHSTFYLNNEVTLSKRVSKDGAEYPKRISIGVKIINPLMKDQLESSLGNNPIDMGKYRQLGEVKIGFHF